MDQQAQNLQIFQVLANAAVADGKLDDAEADLLSHFGTQLQLCFDEMQICLDRAQAGVELPGFDDRATLNQVARMVSQLLAIDNDFSSEEEQFLEQFADHYRISDNALNRLRNHIVKLSHSDKSQKTQSRPQPKTTNAARYADFTLDGREAQSADYVDPKHFFCESKAGVLKLTITTPKPAYGMLFGLLGGSLLILYLVSPYHIMANAMADPDTTNFARNMMFGAMGSLGYLIPPFLLAVIQKEFTRELFTEELVINSHNKTICHKLQSAKEQTETVTDLMEINDIRIVRNTTYDYSPPIYSNAGGGAPRLVQGEFLYPKRENLLVLCINGLQRIVVYPTAVGRGADNDSLVEELAKQIALWFGLNSAKLRKYEQLSSAARGRLGVRTWERARKLAITKELLKKEFNPLFI